MFTLTTDTSCDVPRNELDKAGIPWVPLTFTIDGQTYPDDFFFFEQFKAFYEKVRAGAMPTTSQITAFAHEEFFEKLIKEGATDIVHITLSGGLSATYSMACQAAKNLMKKYPACKIEIVDSRGATQVHHMVLDEAAALREQGLSGEQAAKILRDGTNKIHVLIVVDDLNHLRRGGRVSGVAAAIGSLLKIKPILTFDKEGQLKVVHKAKGFRKAMDYAVEYMSEWAPQAKTVYMAHADAMPLVCEATEIFENKFGCTVKAGWCGPVIGAHTGAGMLGIIFKSDKERPM